MYTKKQLESGEGFLVTGHTIICQRGGEDVFVTDGKATVPNVKECWHVAGGGRLLADGTASITWCDLR